MISEHQDRNIEIPEADYKDQLTPIEPDQEEVKIKPLHTAVAYVSEADWVDQQIPVPLDDDKDSDTA